MTLGEDHRAAFEALVRQWLPVLQAILFKRVASYHDCEDILQEALTSAYRAYPTARPRNARNWLIGVLHHKIKDFYRAQAREAKRTELLGQAGDDQAPDRPSREVELQGVSNAVTDAISSLGGKHQEVLYLRFILELTPVEIAEQLGLKEGTVRVRLSRGTTKLAELLRKRGYEP